LLYKEPALEYNPFSKAASVPLSFGGSMENVKLAPMINLAVRTLRKAAPAYRAQTYSLLETCTVTLLHDVSMLGIASHITNFQSSTTEQSWTG
jgi:transformation/transcription domain-associated protein